MTSAQQKTAPGSRFNPSLYIRFGLSLILAFGGAFASFALIRDGFIPLASVLIAVVVFLILIALKGSLSPYRWMATGIILAVLFTVFPIFYTVYLSFTNMSSGHFLTKQQAITNLEKQTYTAENAESYSWTAYVKDDSYLFLLKDSQNKTWIVGPGRAIQPYDLQGDPPAELEGRTQMDGVAALTNIQTLSELKIGVEPDFFAIQGLDSATPVTPKYSYLADSDSIKDLTTNTVYKAIDGTFTSESGEKLTPGFISNNGVANYSRFLGNEGYSKPILEIIVWNIAFSFLSVLISFAMGMLIALLFENLPGQRIIRALLILPYPIPVLVSIMVWKGLLNENLGLVTSLLTMFFGDAPKFFTDVTWARFAVILINVYLSYPYFYILCSGALKSIPRELYEAADIDGANWFQSYRYITSPMTLRILMPLLIASFCFNFNNFTLIWGYNAGLPAMADSIVPMGHTDLLVSFIYRLGFNMAGAADYGFSAAITVMLFLFVGLMVFFQTRNTRLIKESK